MSLQGVLPDIETPELSKRKKELVADVPGTSQNTIGRIPVELERCEYKYLISPALVEPIRSFIKPYCEIDPHADREMGRFYTIRTLYLDTSDYRTYWDKMESVHNRFKLRVRAYSEGSVDTVKLEVKRRFKDVYVKTSVSVPADAWARLITAPAEPDLQLFTGAEKSAFENFLWLTQKLRAKPTMLVRYERQAFQSSMDRYVRISFDRRIVHCPHTAYDLNGRTSAWRSNDDPASLRDRGALILELKFKPGAPIWLSEMLRRFDLVRGSFSKYCTAVTRTFGWRDENHELLVSVPTAGLTGRRRPRQVCHSAVACPNPLMSSSTE